ncbi:MAG: hypothetical protein M1579_06485 [Gammaproteobacteria bacterium]|nr:hypothetical protein [Gammaproteobacteria bacterium]
MSAREKLQSYGVTMEAAYSFVLNHLEVPTRILSVCQEFGITTSMLTEIVGSGMPGVTDTDVVAFFADLGLDATELDLPVEPDPIPEPREPESPAVEEPVVVEAPLGTVSGVLNLLQGYGVSMDAASTFVQSNLQTPEVIFETSRQFSINNAMLAEIMSTYSPGTTAEDVILFFAQENIDSYQLDTPTVVLTGTTELST